MSEADRVTIVQTKLFAPQPARDVILRRRLIEVSPIGVPGAATLISAPPGYGKSTYVAQCVTASGERCAWLSLDPSDSDLRRFASYVVAAMEGQFPACCPETAACVRMPALYSGAVLSEIFTNEVQALREPLLLVLDDYHAVSSQEVHDFVSGILRRPPTNLHLVIITRRDPPLPLQSLRAQGRLREVRARNLAFSDQEAGEFLQGSLGRVLTENMVVLLNQRNEGWPAGLRLACLAAATRSSPGDLMERISGELFETRDYLLREVLENSGPQVKRYLLVTSYLDRFCASLCDAVAQHDVHGSGEAFIRHLRDAGLFAIALDSSSTWFRFHHLFQSMLQHEARMEMDETAIQNIHQRAATWFEAHQLLDEAIQHLLNANQPESVAELIIRQRHWIMNNELWYQLDGWLRKLPPGLAGTKPALLLLKARLQRAAGSREEIQQTLERVEALLASSKLTDDVARELEGSLESIRCFELYAGSDGHAAIASARRALALLPDADHAERGFAYLILAGALQMIGDVAAAKRVVHEALSGGPNVGEMPASLKARLLISLCFVNWFEADLRALTFVARETASVAGSGALGEVLTVARMFEAAAYYHSNQLAIVHECLGSTLATSAIASPEYHAHCMIISLLAYQELGNSTAAAEGIQSLRELSLKMHNIQLVQLADAVAAEVSLRQGRIIEALEWARTFEPEPFVPNYVFFLPQLTLLKILILDNSIESRERAGPLLDRFLAHAERIHSRRSLIEGLALRALFRAESDPHAALEDLGRSITLAQPGRFIRLFVDLGPLLGNLLNRLKLEDDSLAYVGEIVAAFRENTPAELLSGSAPAKGAAVGVEVLSAREHQVLELIARRLSNKEIAAKLHISDVTVKRHAANIYQKLGVHGRRQSVAKAEGLGILDKGTRGG